MVTTTRDASPRGWSRASILLGACLAGLAGGGTARAADEAGLVVEEAGPRDRVTRQERPFGFVTDATTPSAGVVSLGYAFGVGSGISADRPLPVNLAAGAGGSHTFSLGYGATGRLAPYASATFTESTTSTGTVSTTAMAGAAYQFTSPLSPYHVALAGGLAYEGVSGTYGVSTLAAASVDYGALKVAANLRADKMFGTGRDSVDLFTLVGASYRVASGVRLGLEYVGQDLEDLFEDDLEGGARHAVGPSVAFDLDRGRYQITVASGFGLNSISPTAVVRAGLTLNY